MHRSDYQVVPEAGTATELGTFDDFGNVMQVARETMRDVDRCMLCCPD